MRDRLPPRLYLDPTRRRWVIRDGSRFMRTGLPEEAADEALEKLRQYLIAHDAPASWKAELPPLNRRAARSWLVYLLTCDAPDYPIKIGIATDLAARVRGLQCALPYPVIVLASFPGTAADERGLHREFHEARLDGEWFRRTPEILAFIADIRERPAPISKPAASRIRAEEVT